jgi:hypothetical protein
MVQICRIAPSSRTSILRAAAMHGRRTPKSDSRKPAFFSPIVAMMLSQAVKPRHEEHVAGARTMVRQFSTAERRLTKVSLTMTVRAERNRVLHGVLTLVGKLTFVMNF